MPRCITWRNSSKGIVFTAAVPLVLRKKKSKIALNQNSLDNLLHHSAKVYLKNTSKTCTHK